MSVRIIGAEDWAIYGRDTDGRLLYVIVEVWPEWLNAPHKGEAEYGTPESQEDWRYMMRLVQSRNRAGAVEWEFCEYELGASDEEFRQNTRERFGY